MKRAERLINIVSLVLILIFGTLVAERYGGRLDLTEKKLYTLSPATIKMLNTLNDTVNVKVIFSKDIPSPYSTQRRYVIDMLKDYSRASGGKIILDVINPKDSARFEEAARLYGIPPVQMNAFENNQIQIKRVYMGLAFIKGDRIETIPVLADVNQLEYQISSTIKTLMREHKKVVGFLSGHDEKPLGRLREYLKKQYDVKTVNPTDDDLKGLDLLVVAGPQKEFKDKELRAIDQFILKGGKALFLIDRIQADPQYGFGREIKTGIERLLKNYGIDIRPSLVIDLSAGMINVSERRGGFVFTTVVPYPFFPKIINLNRDSIITRDIDTITLAFSSPIETKKSKAVQYLWLAKTSERSGIVEAPFFVGITRRFSRRDFSGPSSIVALMADGKFRSMFADSKDKGPVKEGQSRMVVVSDSDFATDEMLSAPVNIQFVVNAIDWLSEDDSLISIRSKQVQARPIKQLSAQVERVLKYTIILVPAILAVFLAVVLWTYRKARRVRL
jgi:gliding-associated putative ABC transporter substrate-binding component GldG